jgi:hypothetical protein
MSRMAGFLLACVVVGASPSPGAQVPDQFDTSQTMTIKGTVAQFAVNPGQSYLVIETKRVISSLRPRSEPEKL